MSAYGLPSGFSDVQSLAATGHGEMFRAYVATTSVPTSAPPEQIAVVLADSPIAAKGARRLMRGDCFAAAALNGTPGILPVRDLAFTDEQRPFLVTDPVLGTLQQRIAGRGPLPVAEAVALGMTLARALAAAHAAGVLHLGVGTDSVFFLPGAAEPEAALGHFGFAWAVRRPSRPEVPAAALVHAPRELFGWEEPGASSDVYGLGSVLRTALTGRPAFEDEARIGRAALYHRLLQGPAPALAGTHRLPEDLVRLLDRMTEPEAARRPAIEQVVAGFEALAAGGPAGRVASRVTSQDPVLPLAPPVKAAGAAPAGQSIAASPTSQDIPPAAAGSPFAAAPATRAVASAKPVGPVAPAGPAIAVGLSTVSTPTPLSTATALPPSAAPPPAASWPTIAATPDESATAGKAFGPDARNAEPQRLPTTRETAQVQVRQDDCAGPSWSAGPASPAQSRAAHQPFRPPHPDQAPTHTARRRHTPLLLLATAAVAALAAGVVWGVVTAPGHHAATQTSGGGQATPLPAPEQAPYLAAGVAAKPDGPDQITVTWRTPSSMAGVSSFLIRASLYGHWDVEQTADPTATSRAFTGLTPGKYYCFAIYTLVERPGAQPQFAMTTVDDKACAFPGR